MGRWTKLGKAAAAFLAAAVLCGCQAEVPLFSGSKGEKEYGRAEAMAIVTTERHRYEELYTDQIWHVTVDNRGTTFEASLLDQIHDFMRELKIMSLMAKEQEIRLSGQEEELVNEAASRYMETLGEPAAEELGLDETAMKGLFSYYWLAEKLAEHLTGSMDLEVSDSEARVITVSQIVLEDAETAANVLSQVQAEGADFYAIAKETSVSEEIKVQLGRGEAGSAYEEAACGLEAGEISDVVAGDGQFYIIRCENDYDEEATRLHKETMIQDRKDQAFYAAYQAFKAGVTLTEEPETWEGITISQSPATPADFFEVFEEVCEGGEMGS